VSLGLAASSEMVDDVLKAYAAAAGELIAVRRGLPPQLYAPAADLLPSSAARIADIGAGKAKGRRP
jgi:hypothetical protein